MPGGCGLQPVEGGVQTWRPSQGKGRFVPLLWGCTVAASALENVLGLGPVLMEPGGEEEYISAQRGQREEQA